MAWKRTGSPTGSRTTPARRRRSHAALTGQAFFPHLIAGPFGDGLDTAFTFAIVACLVAAAASLLRGGQYHHAEEPATAMVAVPEFSGAISTTKGS
jgi:hypothetical protein